jgi:hypothetical protein
MPPVSTDDRISTFSHAALKFSRTWLLSDIFDSDVSMRSKSKTLAAPPDVAREPAEHLDDALYMAAALAGDNRVYRPHARW